MNKEIKFKYCVIKPFKDHWAVFTPTFLIEKEYVYYITRGGLRNSFLNIPMWTKN